MIVYRVVCRKGHEFDGWFRDSASFDAQAEAGAVACPVCGSVKVSKAMMAPNVATSGALSPARPGDLAQARRSVTNMLRKVRDHVEKNFDYVGDRFAEEARRIHYGEADERGIYGEATSGEVSDLMEEGVSVAPLPELPDKAN